MACLIKFCEGLQRLSNFPQEAKNAVPLIVSRSASVFQEKEGGFWQMGASKALRDELRLNV